MLRAGVQLLPDGRIYVGASHGEQELQLANQAIEFALESVRP
jgi:hypothetical protein